MFQIDQAEHILAKMLEEEALSLDKLELKKNWEVFKAFVKLPFHTQTDGILFEYGVYHFPHIYPQEAFYFCFTRQLQVFGEEEYEQLHCDFLYEATDELRKFDSYNQWWFADEEEQQDTFLESVEAHPVFRALINGYTPVATVIYQGST